MKKFLMVFKDAGQRLVENDPLRLGSSTAFFAVFAIPPIVIIISNIIGIFYSREIISNKIFNELGNIVGPETAASFHSVLENITSMSSSIWFTIGGSVALLFIATTLFMVIQQSLNQVFRVKQDSDRPWLRTLIDRSIALGFILFSGILFLAVLLADTAISFTGDYITNWFEQGHVALIKTANVVVSFLLASIWFAVLFIFLPAIKLHWKAVLAGSTLTGLLLLAGKNILNMILLSGKLQSIYGASASAVLLLLFIFYFSLILYYGACFTIAFAQAFSLTANTSGLFLDVHERNPTRLGVFKSPVSAGRGSGNFLYDIMPGKPDESITIYRMRSTDPGVMMPELGRKMVHEEGIKAVAAWIAEMKHQEL